MHFATTSVFALVALAYGVSAASIKDLPECAQQPVLTALTSSPCGITNLECVCHDKTMVEQIRTEVMKECSKADLEAALSFASGVCTNVLPKPKEYTSQAPTHKPVPRPTEPPSYPTITAPKPTKIPIEPPTYTPSLITDTSLSPPSTYSGPMTLTPSWYVPTGSLTGPGMATGTGGFGKGNGTVYPPVNEAGSLDGARGLKAWGVVVGVIGVGVFMAGL